MLALSFKFNYIPNIVAFRFGCSFFKPIDFNRFKFLWIKPKLYTFYTAYLFLFLLQGELLLLNNLELVTEVEFGGLLLQLREFVLVFGHLLQCGLNAIE